MPCSLSQTDLVMAEYITVLVANGRTSEEITEEMLERMCALLYAAVPVFIYRLPVIGPDYGECPRFSYILYTHLWLQTRASRTGCSRRPRNRPMNWLPLNPSLRLNLRPNRHLNRNLWRLCHRSLHPLALPPPTICSRAPWLRPLGPLRSVQLPRGHLLPMANRTKPGERTCPPGLGTEHRQRALDHS